jgi:hypothetical protein
MSTIKHLSVTTRRLGRGVLVLAAFALPSSQAATLWTGPNTNFAQSPATPSDVVLAGKVVLTRNGNNVLYNTAAGETSPGPSSPLDTEWAFGTLTDYSTLSYQSLESMRNGDLAALILNKAMVMHLINEDIYLSVEFTDWGQNFAGGFAYARSTPAQVTPPPPPAAPSVTWTNPAPIAYGTALSSVQLNAAASVPGSFAYTPANGTVLNAGANTLSVIFTPADTVDYSSAIGSVGLAVLPAPLTVTAADASRAYGQTNPVFTGAITGVANGDNITATYGCSATAASPAGTYPIIPSLLDPSNRETNYTVSLLNGTFAVLPATPSVTWTNPAAITYGTALSSVQLNAAASVPGSFAYTPANGTVLNAGANTLSVIFTPADTVDYSSAIGSVGLAVLPAPLTVTAADASRAYGQTNPVFTGAITGVANGDNITATYGCSATAASPAGTYPIIPSLLDPSNRETNYTVSLLNGTFAVLPATPSVTWTNPAAIT